jgi:hypothetical protein
MGHTEIFYTNIAALVRAWQRGGITDVGPLLEQYGLPIEVVHFVDGRVSSVFSMDYREGLKKPLVVHLDYWDNVDVSGGITDRLVMTPQGNAHWWS